MYISDIIGNKKVESRCIVDRGIILSWRDWIAKGKEQKSTTKIGGIW